MEPIALKTENCGLQVGASQARLGDGRGFSLIEMLVALLILSFSMLGLMNLSVTSIQVNMQNDVRNTAIRLTNEMAEILLAQPIDNLQSGNLNPYDATNPALLPDFQHFPNPDQAIRNFTQTYNVGWTVNQLSNDLREVQISVGYTFRGRAYTNNAVIYKHRAI